jgi:gluconate:H+ symporter, GntP family
MTFDLIRILFALMISIGIMIALNRFLNVHAFFCLIAASLVLGITVGKNFSETVLAMQQGFGSLLQQIGFIVAIGSCLGMVMEKTGAMEVISQTLIHAFGSRRSVLAMSVIGWMVGIPVFCDSGFIILSRLIPSIAAQSSVPGASLALSLSTGLYATHTLVPPTPGPLAAAATLGLSDHLGQVILIGLIGSIPVTLVAYFFSLRIGRTISVSSLPANIHTRAGNISRVGAFLPLVLPILLITFATVPKTFGFSGTVSDIILAVGQPLAALLIGLVLSLTLISKQEKNTWPSWFSEALKDAGIILLITGAGGGFGFVIKSSGIDLILKQYLIDFQTQGIIFLVAAYGIAALLKTAQGSTTSSLIITSSLLSPLALSAGFQTPEQLAFLMLAMGGGAMTVSHANDSYFWVVSQFGGIGTRDIFRSFTWITFLQGITALFTAIVLFLLW